MEVLLERGSQCVCLPERFESDGASPHHHGKLADGRNHFPRVKRARAPINIALICMTTGNLTVEELRIESRAGSDAELPSCDRCPQLQLERKCCRCLAWLGCSPSRLWRGKVFGDCSLISCDYKNRSSMSYKCSSRVPGLSSLNPHDLCSHYRSSQAVAPLRTAPSTGSIRRTKADLWW